MRVAILLAAVVSTAWAETKNVERPARAPQGQIRHDTNAAGTRVDLKYVTPQEQWRSRAVGNTQRIQRAEGGSAYHQRQSQRAVPHQQQQQQQQLQRLPSPPQPVQQAQQQIPGPQYYSYKPYTAVPSHIKQLIDSAYQPQAPYVDPTSFLYSSSFVAPQQYEQQQPAPAASEQPRAAYLPSARYQSIDPRRVQPAYSGEYSDRRVERQDRAGYGDEYAQQQQQQQQEQQQAQQVAAVPFGTMPEPPLPTLYLDRNMPTEIKQLLQYQAQIPYDVTANRIQYTPKSVFVPKPLSDDAKGQYYYRSKVYYEDGKDAGYPRDHKPVDEQQRH